MVCYLIGIATILSLDLLAGVRYVKICTSEFGEEGTGLGWVFGLEGKFHRGNVASITEVTISI